MNPHQLDHLTDRRGGLTLALLTTLEGPVTCRVAPDVTAVTLHTAAQGGDRATFLDGWVLAWWPGENEGQENLDKDVSLALGFDTVRLTRADGTTTTLTSDAVMTPRRDIEAASKGRVHGDGTAVGTGGRMALLGRLAS